MNDKYIDLVLARHDNCSKVYLFRAPSGTYLDEGERVIVETKDGETPATVVATKSYTLEDSDLYKLLVVATGAKTPLKRVVSRFRPIKYEEEVTDGNV